MLENCVRIESLFKHFFAKKLLNARFWDKEGQLGFLALLEMAREFLDC